MSLRTPPGPSVPKEVHVLKSQCPQRGPNVPKEVHIPQSLRSQGGPCPKEVLMAPNVPRCPQGGPHGPKEVLMSPSPCVPKEVHVLKDVPKEVHVPKSFMSPRMSLRRSPRMSMSLRRSKYHHEHMVPPHPPSPIFGGVPVPHKGVPIKVSPYR